MINMNILQWKYLSNIKKCELIWVCNTLTRFHFNWIKSLQHVRDKLHFCTYFWHVWSHTPHGKVWLCAMLKSNKVIKQKSRKKNYSNLSIPKTGKPPDWLRMLQLSEINTIVSHWLNLCKIHRIFDASPF